MLANEIARRLAIDPEAVCRHLLPAGNRQGREWKVGSVAGEPGESLGVVLEGTKAGVWCDFAAGLSGDLLDLWRQVGGVSMIDAMDAARKWLGVKDDRPRFEHSPRKAAPKPVSTDGLKRVAETPVHKWLNERGIPNDTIRAYGVKMDAKGNAVFPCLHGDKAMMLKYRTPGTKKIWASAESTPVLFGWQAVPEDARTVVITEGELDAMAYHAQGIPAMSVPFGAGVGQKQQWIENEYHRLDRFDRIYVSMDMDKSGDETVPILVDRLGQHRVYVVNLPHKDASDCLKAGVQLQDFIRKARTQDPAELRRSSAFHDAVMEKFYPPGGVPPGLPTPWDKNDMDENLRFRDGELTIWTGINGHGKSLVLSHICVAATGASRWCIASMEMMPATTLARMYQQAGAVKKPSAEFGVEIRDHLDGFVWLFDVHGTAKAERIMEVFAYARARYDIGQFVVDSLAKCGLGEDDYNRQKLFVERLADFSREHNCHVHLVAHARKGEDESSSPGKMDVKGSGGITDMADNVIAVWRNKRKEEKVYAHLSDPATAPHPIPEALAKEQDAVISVHKQRNHDWERSIALWFDAESHQYLQEVFDKPTDYTKEGL